MSSTVLRIVPIDPYGSSAQSAELFPDSIKAALDRLEQISRMAHQNDMGPSAENIEWAKEVLLRVLPRYFLLRAEIDAFQREIHVNWEHGNKRVTVFLPSPRRLKIYCEEVKGTEIEHELVPGTNSPWAVSGVLKWLFE